MLNNRQVHYLKEPEKNEIQGRNGGHGNVTVINRKLPGEKRLS